jgi:hypothetical protein
MLFSWSTTSALLPSLLLLLGLLGVSLLLLLPLPVTQHGSFTRTQVTGHMMIICALQSKARFADRLFAVSLLTCNTC